MVSMKDISAVCGVSVATVSKALNNQSDISEATKEHIRTVAKEMGYFPNSSARALKTNKSYDIGVLFVDEAKSGLRHDYFASVLESFKTTAEEKGYDITFINSNRENAANDKMTYLEHSKYRGFDGVVIVCVNFDDPEVVELVHSDLPIATIDHLFNDRISVFSDNTKGINDLISYIYKQGHRKIAYIHGADSAVTRNRLASFYNMAEELELDIPKEYILQGQYRDVSTAVEMTNKLLDLQDPPTCIVYSDDFAAIGGMNAIKGRNLRIPEDISIAGYDGINIASQIEPHLTTIYQDTTRMGQVAAEKLVNLIEKPKSTIMEHIIVEGELVQGKSVGKIK